MSGGYGPRVRRSGILLGGISALALQAGGAFANPEDGTVVAGAATITANGAGLTINQTSDRAIINWQAFSVGAGETTRIDMPSSLSAILNRVTGASPSTLAGQLSSNGQVYLINPNGVVVGPDGRIDTGAFVASTLDLPDGAFLAGGGMTFMGDSGAGIQVLGTIQTATGDAVLVAAVVDNQGRIAAPNGQAILGAGNEIFYVPDGQSDIVIMAPGAGGASVSNSGAIEAASAQLRAAGSAYALAVNNGGLVSATSVTQVDGRIVLDAGDGTVDSAGVIRSAGGAVTIAGGDVALAGAVDVSAAAGGGDIAVTASRNATLAATSSLDASATVNGDAGAVTAIAGGAMDYRGAIAVRGGAQGGNGGAAEVSGETVAFAGRVDMAAPQGGAGHLLIDPSFVDICDACATTPGAIANALVSGPVTIQADDVITLASSLASGSSNALTFNTNTVNLNASMTLFGPLRLINGGVGGLGGALTSLSTSSILVTRLEILGNYNTINLAGGVGATLLVLNQPDVTASSITIANPANRITAVDATGVNDLTGNVSVRTATSLSFTGTIATTGGAINLVSTGNLTMGAGASLTAAGQTTLASTGGAFVNNAGAGLVAGAGRKVIYAATDAGFNDGGLGYTRYNPVAYGSDPLPGLGTVTYLGRSTTLPGMAIAANSVSRVYGAGNPAFTASYSGGTAADLAVAEQVALTGGPAVNVGSYTLAPSGAVSSTRALSFANGALTVTPAPLTITANNASAVYGTPHLVFGGTISGLVNGDTNAVVSGLSYLATALISFNPNFTIRWANVGTYAINPTGASAANYTITNVPGVLTITPAPLTITATNKSAVYGADYPGFDATFSGLVNGDSSSVVTGLGFTTTAPVTGSPPAVRRADVGTYAINPTGGGASNYAITRAPGVFTITPAPLVITANDKSSIYGSAIPSLDASYNGLVNGDTAAAVPGVALGTAATGGSNAGSYAITVSGGSSSNYAISRVDGLLSITPAPLTITANNASAMYGAAYPVFGGVISGLVNGDTEAVVTGLSYVGTALTVTISGVTRRAGVGTYAINPTGASAANYAITAVPGVFSITPAPLTVTANNASAVYGATYPAFSGTFNGLVNGDTPPFVTGLSFVTTAPITVIPGGSLFSPPTIRRADAGTYAIVPTGPLANYALTAVPGVFTIAPAPLVITANDKSSVYGSAVPALDASYRGLVNGDTASAVSGLSLATAATQRSNAGTYAITASGGSSPNYAITHVNGLLTVARAPLVVTANDATRPQNAPNPPFSVRYSGLVNGDSGAAVVIHLIGTAARPDSPAGSYPIVISGFPRSGIGSGNYDLSFVQGRLTVASTPPPVQTGNNFFTPITTTYTPPATQPTLQAADLEIETVDVDLPGNTVTINPLFNSPLADYGPVAEEVLNEFASALRPPTTTLNILTLLDDPVFGPAIWGALVPFMYTRLESIFAKPESQWTAQEWQFVNAFAAYVTEQRRAAAAKAVADLEAWAVQNLAERQAQLARTQGVAQVYQGQILASSPPIPPAWILAQAKAGLTLTEQQSIRLLVADEALTKFQTAVQGASTNLTIGSLTLQGIGSGSTTSTWSRLLGTVATRKIFPHYAIKAIPANLIDDAANLSSLAKFSRAAGALGRGLAVAGPVGQVAAAIMQTITGSVLYAQQDEYFAAFQEAIDGLETRATHDTIRQMMRTDAGGTQVMTYLLAQGATDRVDPFSNPLLTGTPTRSLDQISDLLDSM